jgi:hypothetical protein
MSKQHFLGSRDSADSFTKYTYLNEGDAACIRVDTESWSGCDVDSVKLGEHSKSYLLSKELAALVEQAAAYEPCKRALRKWAIDFVDFKVGACEEKRYLNSEQMLQRKIAINRAKNIKSIKEKNAAMNQMPEAGLFKKITNVIENQAER